MNIVNLERLYGLTALIPFFPYVKFYETMFYQKSRRSGTKMKSPLKFLAVLLFCLCFVGQMLPASPQGHWEFGFHYSRWSINILRSIIEEGLSEALESDLKGKILEDIQSDNPTLLETGYSQEVAFDSSGDNFGFEIRWYPGGQNGSFSLGLSIEKTTMKVSLPEVSASLALRDELTSKAADFSGAANGEFLMKPLSFHLSFRWDIFPSSIIHPYITLGLGAATGTALEEAEVSYSYSGDLVISGEEPEHYEDSVSKSIKQLKEELEEEGEEFFLPNFVPFVQLNLGIKGVISRNFHFLVDAGIWNGFLLRGGISFRF